MKNKIIYLIIALSLIVYLSYALIESINENNGDDKIIESQQEKINEEKITSIDEMNNEENIGQENNSEYVIKVDKSMGELNITRALVAKMIALAYYNSDDINAAEREIKYEDTNSEEWYDKYINIVSINKWMQGDTKKFYPLSFLTKEEAITVINRVFKVDLIQYSEIEGNENITYSEWINLLLKAMNYIEGKEFNNGIVIDELAVLATPFNEESLSSWTMATDKGKYKFEGLNVDSFIDKRIRVLRKDNDIISIMETIEEEPVVENVIVKEYSTDHVSIFVGGITRKYPLVNHIIVDPHDIIDIKIKGSSMEILDIKKNLVSGKIMKVSHEAIELEDKIYEITKTAKFYQNINGKYYWKAISSLLVGTNIADFILDEEKKICAAIITRSAKIDKIRVVINTDNYTSLIHNNIEITSEGDFEVIYDNEATLYKAGEKLTISSLEHKDLFGVDRIFVSTVDKDKKIIINSIKRGYGDNKKSPAYRGIIEVAKHDNGYVLVNEVDFEQYLYAVVPSEMPTSHGVEAAKVQAVTARSFAYNQYYQNIYHEYGAHIVDSVQSQVYNNIEENDISIKAVNDTKGQVIKYNGVVVSANFFSTSSGFTANSGDVWGSYKNKEFPADTPVYLSSKPQFESRAYEDLSEEETFYKFINDKNLDSYDSEFGWYRWNVVMLKEDIEESINRNLESLYEKYPNYIKTLGENKIFRSRDINNIGKLDDLYIYKRGKGGNIMELVVIGSEKTIKVKTEYVIRSLIRPYQYNEEKDPIYLYRQDEKKYTMQIMPSAFYIMEKTKNENNELVSIKFLGGGYGHGVGMSQNGVKGMVDRGYKYNEILKHYYEGINVENID